MHQKHHHLIIATYSLLVLASPLIWAQGANAQVAWCPAGYVCTPIQQSASTGAFYTTNSAFTNVQNTAVQTSAGQSYVPATVQSAPTYTACSTFSRDLTVGSTGADVSALQQFLVSKGYSVPSTGYFGSITSGALGRYQVANGLSEDGYFGPMTRARVNSSCATSTGTTGTTNTNVQASADIKVNGVDSVGVYNNATVHVSWAAANTSYCQATGSTVNIVGGGTWGNQGRLASTGNADVIAYTGGSLPSDLRIGIQCYKTDGTSVTDYAVMSVNGSNTTTTTGNGPLPYISSISPSAATPPLIATLVGSNLTGASVVNFTNSWGQFAGSATTNNVMADRLYFMIPPGLPAGTYQISVVTNACKAGCDSNKVSFTAIAPTTVTPPVSALSASCTGNPFNSGVPGITWSAQASGGSSPYSYSWSTYNDVSRYGEGSTLSSAFMANYSSVGSKQAAVRVTDTAGRTSTVTCSATIPVSSTVNTTTTVTPPGTTAGPATTLSISSNSVTAGSSVSLTSVTRSPSGTLRSAAIDQSSDNVNWNSGAPCGYWSNTSNTDNTQHTIMCSYTPTSAGTYYFRSRGTDANGASSFVTQTLTVQAAPVTQTPVTPTYQACGGTAPSGAGVSVGGTYYQTGYGTTQWTFVTSSPAACQWTCTSGYGLSGNGCAATGTTASPTTGFFLPQSCGGTEPASNGYVTKGIGTYQTGYATTQWTFVTTSPGACQYTCSNGGVYNGSGCAVPVSISTPTLSTLSWYADDPTTWPTVSEAAQLTSGQAMRVKGLTGEQYFDRQDGVTSGKLTSSPAAGTTQIELYVYDYNTGTKIANGAVNISVTNRP